MAALTEAARPLWEAFKERGCQQARERLIELYQHYVPLTVDRFRRPAGIERDDLISVGLIALVRAVDRFDPGRGVQFTSFLLAHLRGAVVEELRREDWVPRRVRQQQKAGEAVDIVRLVSLEAVLDRHDEEFARDLRLLERLADPAPGPEALCLAAREREELRAAVDGLRPPLARVVREHYYDGRLMREVAAGLERVESRASQFHQEALRDLRRVLTKGEEGTMETTTAIGANGRARALGDREAKGAGNAGENGGGRRGEVWTPGEDAVLRAEWATASRREIAAKLGRSVASLYPRAAVLGLRGGPAAPVNGATAPAWPTAPRDGTGTDAARVTETTGPEPEEERAWEPPAWTALPVVRRHEDAELQVMGELCRLVGELDERARTRVLRWLADRWGLWKS